MTIHSYYYQKPSNLIAFPKINTTLNIKKIKRSSVSYVNDFNKGTTKKFILGGIIGFFSFLIIAYVYNLSMVTKLDYQIYNLKEKIITYEKENAELKTKMIKNISPESIAKWAEMNGFVKNESFSSFEIKNLSVAVKNNNF